MNKNKHSYGIYDLTDNERLIGIFSADEAAEYLNITIGSLYSNVTRKNVSCGKYIVEKVVEGEQED